MRFLECHDPNKYRKKIKGFRLAFNIREKEGRVPEEDPTGKNYKFKSNLSADELKMRVKHMKEVRSKQ